MKSNLFFSFLCVSLILFMSSCEIHDHVLNGVVQIDIESHERGEIISNGGVQNIKVRFTSDTEIQEASVSMYIEDASKFTIEGNRIKLNEDAYLNVLPRTDQVTIIDFENKSVNNNEYVYEQEVDLSAYPAGTCFVLFGSALGSSEISEGYDSQGVYFTKRGRR